MVGNKTTVKVVKNKVAPPFRTAVVEIMYGEGVSKEGELIDLAVVANVLEKSGAWYAYNGNKIGQGKENAKIFLKENKKIYDDIEKKTRKYFGLLTDKEEKSKE